MNPVMLANASTHVALATTSPLLKMLYSSVVAGVGVTIVFSIAILGATRSSDMRRADRPGAANAYAALAVAGLLASVSVVVYGLVLVAHK